MGAAALVLSAAVLLQEADALYARRAEGASGARAAAEPAAAAVAAYRRALAADPGALPARAGLVRALFFEATFAADTPEERRGRLEEARTVGEEGLRALARGLPREDSARLAALGGVPGAVDLHYWTAAAWGEWALARGKLAAATAGAAGRIRELGQVVLELDAAYEQGGGDRVLGRLHDQAPRIPLVTGWVSRDRALAHLRRALEHGPQNTVNQVFLAEALLRHRRREHDQARRLLERCAAAEPRPELPVEDAFYIARARKLLTSLRR